MYYYNNKIKINDKVKKFFNNNKKEILKQKYNTINDNIYICFSKLYMFTIDKNDNILCVNDRL